MLFVAYGIFLTFILGLFHLIVNDALSAILTIAEMLQCLAVGLLCIQVIFASSGASGISAKAVVLDAVALCCRLSSTMWLNGYLPVDASGDWFFQAVDIFTLGMLLWLLHQVLVERNDKYQAEKDNFPIWPLLSVSLLLGVLFHADMNSRPLFDSLWMTALVLSSMAVLPQLWLITRTGGKVEALTSHYIACMALGRLCSGIFMWHAREDVTCAEWVDGINHSILMIISAHLLHLLLLGDFAYYYVKAVCTQGLSCQLELDGLANFV